MPDDSWSFRVARGTVTVRDDAVAINSAPGRFLSGQRARWRNGDGWDRARAAFQVAVLPFLLVVIAVHLYTVGEAVSDPSSLFLTAMAAVTVLSGIHHFYRRFLRETRIPLSSVEEVVVDEDAGTLTVAHRTGGGPLSVFREDEEATTLAFPTDEDLRDAREVLRLKRVPVSLAAEQATETVRRVEIRDGACFCERCGSQVSPADATCPACEYALRVEKPTGDETRGDESGRSGETERTRETERSTAR